MFGRPGKAASAELIVLSAGAPRARERAKPLLEVIGSALYELGEDPASANAVKLVGSLRLGHKDARLVLEAADRLNVPMPTANLIRDRYTTSINKGRGELDWSALAIEVFDAAGLT